MYPYMNRPGSTELRILNVIREHYEETTGEVISHDIRHVANDEIYLAYVVVAYESDAQYLIHTETVRVDVVKDAPSPLTFTLLSEHDLDLTNELK